MSIEKLAIWALQREYRKYNRQAGAANALYGPTRFVAPKVFLTKSDQLGCVVRLNGIDNECLDDRTLEDHTAQIDSALRDFDEDYRVYQYVLKHGDVPLEGNESYAATRERLKHLRGKGFYSIDLYVVVMYEPTHLVKPGFGRSKTKFLRKQSDQLSRQVDTLLRKVNGAFDPLEPLLGGRILDSQEAFRFLRTLTSLDPVRAESETLQYADQVDYFMATGGIACHKEGIRIDRAHVEVMTMREPSKHTFAGILRNMLRINSSFVLCTEYKRIHDDEANKLISAAQQHFNVVQWIKNLPAMVSMAFNRGNKADMVADASAQQHIKELSRTMVRLNNKGEHMGEFTMTLVLYDRDREGRHRLESSVARAAKSIGLEASLIRETTNALNAYLSIIPGGHGFNLRQLRVLSTNYADMCLFYAPYIGERQNKHLAAINKEAGEYLVMLETSHHTPYYFNAHEDDLLGCLIFGIMGSGKSFLCNMLIDHGQKHKGYTFVLDVGGSYRYTTAKHNGSYISMAVGSRDFKLNPFACEKTDENLQFLAAFVGILVRDPNCAMSAGEEGEIFEAVGTARRLSDLKLSKHLQEQLNLWIGRGQYAEVFDNAEDTLQFAHFQTFDFQGLDLHPRVTEPLLVYLFHRISQIVHNPALKAFSKQIWCDEVWKFLANPAARSFIVAAGKTWRKHNGGIGLITQSAGDLAAAGILDLVNEICPTKILLANPGADRKFYREIFRLNDREVELFSHLTRKRQILVKTPERCKVLNVEADPRAKFEYSNDPATNIRRDKALALYPSRDEALDALVEGRV